MNKETLRELFRRYGKKKVTPKDQQLIDAWYESLDQDLSNMDAGERKTLRNELHERIVQQLHNRRLHHRVMRRRKMRYLTQAAASLLVACGIGYGLLEYWKPTERPQTSTPSEWVVYEAPIGKLKKLDLPDGTTIWLNAGSRIGLNQPFSDSVRHVQIIAGEVFFDVAQDHHKPFIVQSPTLITQVLGTSFTIKAYPGVKEETVAVSTGQVKVYDPGKSLEKSLVAGQELVYDTQLRQGNLRNRNPKASHSWIEGTSHLDQATFAELAAIMRYRFAIELRASNPKVSRQRYTMQIDSHTPIIDIIKAICSIHKNPYRKEGEEVLIY